jgi:hypothetical protein
VGGWAKLLLLLLVFCAVALALLKQAPSQPSRTPHHATLPHRTTFCLSATRLAWLRQQALTLKVMADNGADVFLNGVSLLADATANHNPVYWNNLISVAGTNTAFVSGECAAKGCLESGDLRPTEVSSKRRLLTSCFSLSPCSPTHARTQASTPWRCTSATLSAAVTLHWIWI